MPTAIIKCQPGWLPHNDSSFGPASRDTTTLTVAGWLPEIIRKAINKVDDLPEGHPEEAKATNVEIDFVPKHGQAINAVPLHIVIHPPQINGDFPTRRLRRAKILEIVFDNLWRLLEANNDHLIIPEWELEVIPIETSGCGSSGNGSVLYSWGTS